jgi:preprotein translocase subunit YajC
MFPASIPVVFAQAMGGGMGTNLLFFGALFAIMYFVLIRPQQKQMKDQQAMLTSLKKGDDVVTQGGMLGKIFSVQDKVVTLEVSSGVKLRVLKSSIQAKVTVTDEPAKAADGDAKKEEK